MKKKLAKKKWLADNLRSCGKLILDEGASLALLDKGKSLLPVGVLKVEGKFERGEVVICIDHMGKEIAKGLVNYSSDESKKICGIVLFPLALVIISSIAPSTVAILISLYSTLFLANNLFAASQKLQSGPV